MGNSQYQTSRYNRNASRMGDSEVSERVTIGPKSGKDDEQAAPAPAPAYSVNLAANRRGGLQRAQSSISAADDTSLSVSIDLTESKTTGHH